MQSFNAPSRSVFSPSIARQYTAPSFRNPTFTNPSNPAFNTPQARRFQEVDFDDSPAMTDDTSGIADSPDFDQSDMMDGLEVASPLPKRISWSDKRSGKGAFPRATGLGFPNDRVRKRPRVDKDRDIGSTRTRLPNGCDEDDSDYEVFNRNVVKRGKKETEKETMGWFHYILSAVSANPDAPIVLSEYMQLLINSFLGGLVLWVVWCGFSSARDEVIYSSGKAKQALQAEIEACTSQYFDNKCDSARMPALESLCNEWEKCKDQDPENVAGVKAVVGHIADIINEFTTRLSWKSIVSSSHSTIPDERTGILICRSSLLWWSSLQCWSPTTWLSADSARMCVITITRSLRMLLHLIQQPWAFPCHLISWTRLICILP